MNGILNCQLINNLKMILIYQIKLFPAYFQMNIQDTSLFQSNRILVMLREFNKCNQLSRNLNQLILKKVNNKIKISLLLPRKRAQTQDPLQQHNNLLKKTLDKVLRHR